MNTSGKKQEREVTTEIIIDGERQIGRISPFIFGQNLEPATCKKITWENSKLSDNRNLRKDVLEIIKKNIKVPMVRWPGGNFASQYHWRDGVGPASTRPVMFETAWRTKENNSFGTDEFIRFCRLIDAEPFITVNAGSGTIDEAVGWVEYCNMGEDPVSVSKQGLIIPWSLESVRGLKRSKYARLREQNGNPDPYDVKYWSVGNETWGDFQVGVMESLENARKAAEYAKVMKQVDPRIKVTGVGMYLANNWRFFRSQSPKKSIDWNLDLLRHAGEIIDSISVHRYFFREVGDAFSGVPFSGENYLSLLACPIYSERKIKALDGAIDLVMDDLSKQERIYISFDEWDFGSRTLAHALATARFFNVLQRLSNSVKIACGEQWVATVLEESLVVEAGHLAFELYQNHSGEIALDTSVQTEEYDTFIEEYRGFDFCTPPEDFKNVPYVDCSASMSGDRTKLYIAAVNAYQDRAEVCNFRLRDVTVKARGTVHELNGADILAANDLTHPDKVRITESVFDGAGSSFTYELPAHSATILELEVY
jgi:alpha-N-arabinofuranosidase